MALSPAGGRRQLATDRAGSAQLAAVGIEPWPLDGVQALACLWERFHPAARTLPDLDALAEATGLAGATTAEEASRRRHRILDAICSGPEPAGIDAADPRWLRHSDGTLEEILHLATPPIHTTLWWLMHLLSAPLPVTVAVHIRVGSRAQVRVRQRRRWKRLSAAIDYKHRRAQLIGSDEHEALAEAELLDAELAAEIGATVYKVSVSVAIRDPGGRPEAFDELVKATAGIPGPHRRPGHPRTLALPARADLDDPARPRSASRNPELRAPQHPPLPTTHLRLMRLTRRAHPGFADPGGRSSESTPSTVSTRDTSRSRSARRAAARPSPSTRCSSAQSHRACAAGSSTAPRPPPSTERAAQATTTCCSASSPDRDECRSARTPGRSSARRDVPDARRAPNGEGAVPARPACAADRRPARQRGPHPKRARGIVPALGHPGGVRALRENRRAAPRDAAPARTPAAARKESSPAACSTTPCSR